MKANRSISSNKAQAFKIVVIGGTGLIGSKVANLLREAGHDVVAASPSRGVNAVTGEGLAEALAGAQIVVDVSNSPSFEDEAVMDFFRRSTAHLLAAEEAAGVGHHVALSVVGTDRLQASGYFRAKLVQENLIKASPIPYTIVRATQFFEFIASIAEGATRDGEVRLSPALMQPIYSSDVAAEVAAAALAQPLNGTRDIAGPEALPMTEVVGQYLRARNDPRRVVADAGVGYFGTPVDDRSLTPAPAGHPHLAPTHLADWLAQTHGSR
ncbi:MAG TPA: SDR family oxidoreductase [Chthoniobacteraceae bacterium]|nr:SDR family oxidoreductase [Chthoniobacteraceae bacterium]